MDSAPCSSCACTPAIVGPDRFDGGWEKRGGRPVPLRPRECISADIIVQSIQGRCASALRHELILRGYEVEGELNLEYFKSSLHLEFRDCEFKGHINLRGAHFASLTFTETTIDTLDGLSLVVDQNLVLSTGFEARGAIRLVNAKIGGRLNMRGAWLREGLNEQFTRIPEFHAVNGSLFACGLEVKGSAFLDEDRSESPPRPFKSVGTITLRGATIDGRLYLRGAHLYPSRENRLFVGGALNKKFRTDDYIFTLATLDGYQLKVNNSAHFSDGFRSEGLIRLSGAYFGGKVTFRDAVLREYVGPTGDAEPRGKGFAKSQPLSTDQRLELKHSSIVRRMPRGAIDAFNCKITGSLYLGIEPPSDDEVGLTFESEGTVSFQEAEIGARVIIANVRMSCGPVFEKDADAKRSYSLDFGSAHVHGSFHIRRNSCFFGAVRVRGMSVGRRFSISGTNISAITCYMSASQWGDARPKPLQAINDAASDSLHGDRKVQLRSIDGAHLTVAQDVNIDDGSVFYGTVDLRNLKAGSDLKIVHTTLYSPVWKLDQAQLGDYNPDHQRSSLLACLNLDGCVCRNILFIENRPEWVHEKHQHVIKPHGNVYLHDAKISETLDIRGQEKDLPNSSKKKDFASNWNPSSRLHLEQTKVGTLRDNRWSPVRLRFHNFTYDVIHRDSLSEESSDGLVVSERCRRLSTSVDRIEIPRGSEGKEPRKDKLRPFRAQPYDQLAKILFLSGEVDASNEAIKKKIIEFLRHKARQGSLIRRCFRPLLPSTFLRCIFAWFGYGMEMTDKSIMCYIVILFAAAVFSFCRHHSNYDWDPMLQTWLHIVVPRTLELPKHFADLLNLRYIGLQLAHLICAALLILAGLGLVKNYSNRSHGV
jgi:hypothetical protein